ncbi:MAG: response regulator [Candidatus Thermoplasmatota archaeon]|nr:response regulator [Candidatus Thermoplasmatota archaeon]
MVCVCAGNRMRSVMIVDEEENILEQVKAALASEDIEVITATDSRQALSQLREDNEETFDLILVNTRMPGSKTTTALFSMKPTVKKQPAGVEDFLQKPFTREQLLEFVKKKIEQ